MTRSVELIRVGVRPIETWSPLDGGSETFRYVDIGAIDRDSKSIIAAAEVPVASAPSRARQLLESNDVLISTVRPNLNAVAMVPEKFDGSIASTGFTVLRANPERLSPRFLFYWVRTPTFIADMMKKATGATYPAVSDRIVLDSTMPMPPVTEQRRIAATLDKADGIRRKRKEAIALTGDLLQSTFLEIFGDPVTNPKGLPRKPLGNLIEVKSGNFLPARNMDTGGSYAVYGGNGINGRHGAYMFADPVITIGRVGAYCGAVHLTEPNSWVTDNALYVSSISSELTVPYLEHALRIANLNQHANQSSQPLVSAARIYPVEILVPRRDAQERFELFLRKHRTVEFRLAEGESASQHLFDSLVHRAFRGEL